MSSRFNEVVNRKLTGAIKWDKQKDGNLPFWIADSDYATAPCVMDSLNEVAHHGVYGYNAIPDEFKEAIKTWYKKRYNSEVLTDWIVPSTGVILEIRILLDIITKENEGVILQTPVYHTFHHVINEMNRKIIKNKLIKVDDTYKMDYVVNIVSLFCILL